MGWIEKVPLSQGKERYPKANYFKGCFSTSAPERLKRRRAFPKAYRHKKKKKKEEIRKWRLSMQIQVPARGTEP